MAILTAFGSYLIKFIVFIAIAAAGYIIGKKLRDNKDAKNKE